MKIDQPTADHLQKWLTSALQKVCDADPGALARYVMALLRKDKAENELKSFCVDQLDVFLQQETVPFVDRLFEVISDKSYLPADFKVDSTSGDEIAAPGTQNNENEPRRQGADVKKEKKGEHERDRDDRDPREARAGRRDSDKEKPKDRASSGGRHAVKHQSKQELDDAPPPKAARKRISPPAPKPQPAASPTRKPGREHRSHSRDDRTSRVSRRERDRRRAESSHGSNRRRDNPSPPRPVAPPQVEKSSKVAERIKSRSPKERVGETAKVFVPPPRPTAGGGSTREVIVARRDPLSGAVRPTPGPPSPASPTSSGGLRSPPDSDDDSSGGSDTPNFDGPRAARGREKCADYEEKGYCMRGDNCPYDHGPDPVVVEDPVCLQNMMPSSTGSQVVGMPNLSVPPPGFSMPSNPPVPGLEPSAAGYASVTRLPPPADGLAYNPEQPSLSAGGGTPFSVPPPGHMSMPPPNMQQSAVNWPGYPGGPPPPRGMYPPTTVRLVGIDGDCEAALVTYASKGDAIKAYRSTEPILNNRFIKVFWHGSQLHPGNGAPGRTVERSDNPAIVQATVSGSVSKTFYNPAAMKIYHSHKTEPETAADGAGGPTAMPASATGPPAQFVASGAAVAASEARDAYIAARRRLKENRDRKQQYVQLRQKKVALMSTALEQQKTLIARMHKCTDAQRKQYVQMFETMTNTIKEYKLEIDEITKKIQGLDKKHSTSGGGVAAAAAAAQNAERAAKIAGVQAEMKQLQTQLQQQKESGTDVTQVMQRIAVLKSELTALANMPRGTRPRRNSYQQRRAVRGAPPASANLDRRPKKLLVAGFDEDNKDQVLQAAQRYAKVTDFSFDAAADGAQKLAVEFATRREAEQVRELLPDCIDGRTLTVEWGPSPVKRTLSKSNSVQNGAENGVKDEPGDETSEIPANVKTEEPDTSGEIPEPENDQATGSKTDRNPPPKQEITVPKVDAQEADAEEIDEDDLLGLDDSSEVGSRRSAASRQMSATEMLDALGEGPDDSDENGSDKSDGDQAFAQ